MFSGYCHTEVRIARINYALKAVVTLSMGNILWSSKLYLKNILDELFCNVWL